MNAKLIGKAATIVSLAVSMSACSPATSESERPETATSASPTPTPSPSPLATAAASFGSEHSPKPPPPPPAVSPPQPSTMTGIWLGVLETVRNPNKLDDDLKTLRRRFGGSILVAQVFCWPGINEGRNMPDDAYFLAFITGSLPAAQALVAESGHQAEFYARVTDRCGG